MHQSLLESGERMEATEETPPKSIHDKITTYKNMIFEAYKSKSTSHWILLLLSSLGMLIAFPASSLLSRLYFSNGGKSKWIISWVSVAGWPIPLLILLPLYIFTKTTPTPLTMNLTLSYIGLGFLSAVDNLMYAYAYAYLPASTASLLASTVLIFSAIFGYFLVKNKLNLSTINSIVVITSAMAIIALDSNSDRFSYITNTQYALGFMWDVLGSALHGLIFALTELVFIKLLQGRAFHVVLEQQVMVSFFAFVFTTIGVVVNNDFYNMGKEGEGFIGGVGGYYMVIIWGIVSFQLGVMGSTGVLYLSSTVLAGVLNSIRVPLTSIAAVILMNDPMSGLKILSIVVTFWGFACYIYASYPISQVSSPSYSL